MAKETFTRITNDLYGAMMQTDFTKRQRKILDLIIRMSYGCGKESALLRLKDFELVGIHKTDIRKELDYLQSASVLLVAGECISINKNHKGWRIGLVRMADQARWQEVLRRNLAARVEQHSNDSVGGILLTDSQNSVKPVSKILPISRENTNIPVSETLPIGRQNTDFLVGEILPNSAVQPAVDAACGTPKEKSKEIKEIGKEIKERTTLPQLLAQYQSYTPSEIVLLQEYWQMIGQARRVGEVSTYAITQKMNQWQGYPADIVLRAVEVHLASHRDKLESYTDGIIRRLMREESGELTKPGRSQHQGQSLASIEAEIEARNSRYAHLFVS